MTRYTILLSVFLFTLAACEKGEPEKVGAKSSFADKQRIVLDQVRYGALYPLSEGKLEVANKISIGRPARFVSEVDDVACYPVTVENQSIGWIYHAYQAGKRMLLYKCETFKGEPFSADTKYGQRVSSAIFEITWSNGKWILSNMEIPYFTYFSNDSICNDKIAYWGSKNNNHYAAIFDLEKNSMVRKVKIGEFEMRTDNAGYFPLPQWNKECTNVVYPKHSSTSKDIVINMK